MIELRNKNLRSIRSDIRLPDYDRSQLRPGIVHLGVGNFHRVHQATAIEECLCVPSNEHWAIFGYRFDKRSRRATKNNGLPASR